MRDMPTYSLKELAKLADVTPRTIRFYIEQGLLPSPGQVGPATRYTDEHFELLLTIKKLQTAHFPLAEIRARLRTMTTDQRAELSEAPTGSHASDSAVDYIRRVMGRPTEVPVAPMQPMAMPRMKEPEPQPQPTDQTMSQPQSQRSQWERIPLDPDVELHVRRPLTRNQNKRVERLIAIARELFEED
jgi:DNA-binding transcriptional MerR regulator